MYWPPPGPADAAMPTGMECVANKTWAPSAAPRSVASRWSLFARTNPGWLKYAGIFSTCMSVSPSASARFSRYCRQPEYDE